MKIKLLKCFTCDHWYSPRAHYNRCPVCSTMATVINRTHYSLTNENVMRVINRVIPRISVNHNRAIMMASNLWR